MKLTSFTDYSLRVLIFLAADPARRATIARDGERLRHLREPPDEGRPLARQEGGCSTCAARAVEWSSPRRPRRSMIGRVVRATEGAPNRPNVSDRIPNAPHRSAPATEGRPRRSGRGVLRGARPLYAGRPRAQPFLAARPHPARRPDCAFMPALPSDNTAAPPPRALRPAAFATVALAWAFARSTCSPASSRRCRFAFWAAQFSGALGQRLLPGRCGTRTRCCSASRSPSIVGFLFTAGRNWTGRPTPTGPSWLRSLRCGSRARVSCSRPSAGLRRIVNAAFPVAAAVGLAMPLVAPRQPPQLFLCRPAGR